MTINRGLASGTSRATSGGYLDPIRGAFAFQ